MNVLRRVVGVVVLGAFAPVWAHAQRLDDTRTAVRRARLAEAPIAADSAKHSRFPVDRFLLGVIGFVGGAYFGGKIASETAGPCNCDDLGLSEAISGALIGGTVGAALASSMPDYQTSCSFGGRLGRAFAGAIVGTASGIILTLVTSGYGVFAIPVTSAAGAAATQAACTRQARTGST